MPKTIRGTSWFVCSWFAGGWRLGYSHIPTWSGQNGQAITFPLWYTIYSIESPQPKFGIKGSLLGQCYGTSQTWLPCFTPRIYSFAVCITTFCNCVSAQEIMIYWFGRYQLQIMAVDSFIKGVPCGWEVEIRVGCWLSFKSFAWSNLPLVQHYVTGRGHYGTGYIIPYSRKSSPTSLSIH